MKEIRDILAAYDAWRTGAKSLALATVVRVEGSAYRAPGARMLIGDGQTVGGVSGGCIERDCIQRAGGVVLAQIPSIVRYDTTLEADGTPGYSLGCGGTIDVLIEPLPTTTTPDAIRLLAEIYDSHQPAILATVIASIDPAYPLAARRIVGSASHTSPALLAQANNVQTSQRCGHIKETTACGKIEWFIEPIVPPVQLILFGAGTDARPLVDFASALGWNTTIVDLRSSPATGSAPPPADRIVRASVETLGQALALPPRAAVVVMTHNYAHDLACVRWIAEQENLGAALLYLGLLGPRHRTRHLLETLGDGAIAPFPPEHWYWPVGLDLGAQAPEEVALAIVAEITAVLRQGTGRPLRDRPGPIHARPDDALAAEPIYNPHGTCPATL